MKHLLTLIFLACCMPVCVATVLPEANDSTVTDTEAVPDTIVRLTDNDYLEVAERLGVEVAAMKAVVEIEAGVSHQGFFAPG